MPQNDGHVSQFFGQSYFNVLMKTLLLKSSAQRGNDELVNICFPKSLFYFFFFEIPSD